MSISGMRIILSITSLKSFICFARAHHILLSSDEISTKKYTINILLSSDEISTKKYTILWFCQ